MTDDDLHEYPSGHVGTRRYVSVRGYSRFIPAYKTFKGRDGYNYILPDYGGLEGPCASEGPYIMSDMQEYVSPLDGTTVSSRSTHRDHMRKHDVVEAPDPPKRTPQPESPSRVAHDIVRAIHELGGH